MNYISKNTTNIVYGFDSFEGLPEKWRVGFNKGAFEKQHINISPCFTPAARISPLPEPVLPLGRMERHCDCL